MLATCGLLVSHTLRWSGKMEASVRPGEHDPPNEAEQTADSRRRGEADTGNQGQRRRQRDGRIVTKNQCAERAEK